MFSPSRIDHHLRLMHRMGDALGVDFEAEMMCGRLSPEDYRSRVLACAGCREADACARLLDSVESGLAEAPGYCRNKAEFDVRAG